MDRMVLTQNRLMFITKEQREDQVIRISKCQNMEIWQEKALELFIRNLSLKDSIETDLLKDMVIVNNSEKQLRPTD